MKLSGRCLDLDIDTSWQVQLIERFDRLGGSLNDIDQTLVRPHFKLLTCLLVDMRTSENGIAFNAGRQRNGTMHFRMGPLRRIDDVESTLIQDRVIVSFHPNANNFFRHVADPY